MENNKVVTYIGPKSNDSEPLFDVSGCKLRNVAVIESGSWYLKCDRKEGNHSLRYLYSRKTNSESLPSATCLAYGN